MFLIADWDEILFRLENIEARLQVFLRDWRLGLMTRKLFLELLEGAEAELAYVESKFKQAYQSGNLQPSELRTAEDLLTAIASYIAQARNETGEQIGGWFGALLNLLDELKVKIAHWRLATVVGVEGGLRKLEKQIEKFPDYSLWVLTAIVVGLIVLAALR